MKYSPKRIDTSDIELSEELLALTEALAKNTHETWSEGRIRDGWKYGIERDDATRTTPCLVPYEELTEEEKEFDRATALEAIRFIIKMGFTVEKKK